MLQQIVSTLRGHVEQINCLASFGFYEGKDSIESVEIVSSSADGDVRSWMHDLRDNISIWRASAVLQGKKGSMISLTCTTAHYAHLIAAVDTFGCVQIWQRDYKSCLEFSFLQEIQILPSQMPKDLHMIALTENSGNNYGALMLCMGCVDYKIRCYIANYQIKTSSNSSYTSYESFVEVASFSGHEDWVTCLSTQYFSNNMLSNNNNNNNNNNVLLASGSQDSKIRLWKFCRSVAIPDTSNNTSDMLLPAIIPVTDDADVDRDGEDFIELDEGTAQYPSIPEDEQTGDIRASFVSSGSYIWTVYLEAILVGHEEWVTSVRWLPNTITRLFSTSMDRNMVIWNMDTTCGIWSPLIRMGDIGGSLGGSLGANLLGFVSGVVAPDGNTILGIGYGSGAFHMWARTDSGTEGGTGPLRGEKWFPVPFLTGHFGKGI